MCSTKELSIHLLIFSILRNVEHNMQNSLEEITISFYFNFDGNSQLSFKTNSNLMGEINFAHIKSASSVVKSIQNEHITPP